MICYPMAMTLASLPPTSPLPVDTIKGHGTLGRARLLPHPITNGAHSRTHLRDCNPRPLDTVAECSAVVLGRRFMPVWDWSSLEMVSVA